MKEAKYDRYVLNKYPKLTGKKALVTGATGSIGFAVARYLLLLGADVSITYRNLTKAKEVKDKLEAEFNKEVKIHHLDLSDIDEVKSFPDSLKEPIDILFNVAGTYHLDKKIVNNKYELTFLSDFLSVAWLNRGFLRLNKKMTIINTGSLSMYYSHVDFADIMSIQVKNKTVRYGRDKRLLALDTLNLKESYPEAKIILAHPGVSATSLFEPSKGGFNKAFKALIFPLMKVIFMSPEKASLSILNGLITKDDGEYISAPRGFLHSWGYPKMVKLRKSLLNSKEKDKLKAIYNTL